MFCQAICMGRHGGNCTEVPQKSVCNAISIHSCLTATAWWMERSALCVSSAVRCLSTILCKSQIYYLSTVCYASLVWGLLYWRFIRWLQVDHVKVVADVMIHCLHFIAAMVGWLEERFRIENGLHFSSAFQCFTMASQSPMSRNINAPTRDWFQFSTQICEI